MKSIYKNKAKYELGGITDMDPKTLRKKDPPPTGAPFSPIPPGMNIWGPTKVPLPSPGTNYGPPKNKYEIPNNSVTSQTTSKNTVPFNSNVDQFNTPIVYKQILPLGSSVEEGSKIYEKFLDDYNKYYENSKSTIGKDTLIDLTNQKMGWFPFNVIPSENYSTILGNNYIETTIDNGEFTNYTTAEDYPKNWIKRMQDPNDTFRNKYYADIDGSFYHSKDIPAFYGIENGKFKVGNPNEFSENTIIVPVRGNTPYSKVEFEDNLLFDKLYTYDKLGNKLWNLNKKDKFIVYSPVTKKAIFRSQRDDSSLTETKKILEDFLKKNPNPYIITIDEGRFKSYLNNPKGITEDNIKYWNKLAGTALQGYLENDNYIMTSPIGKGYGYNIGIIKQQSGGYKPGGIFKDPPVNPVPSPIPLGVNVFATTPNSVYKPPYNPLALQTLPSSSTNVDKQKLPTKEELTKNQLLQNLEKRDKIYATKGPEKQVKLTQSEQKLLEKQIEAQTFGQQRVTYNQFGEPVLKWDPTQPKASGRVEPDYMDPITMAATFGAGAYGLGYSLPTSLGIAVDNALFNLPSLGKSGLNLGYNAVKNAVSQSMESGLLSNAQRLNSLVNSNIPRRNNFNLEELRRIYHNSERFLQPQEARFLHQHGLGLRENYRTDMSNFGWGTNQWNVNNQLSPPPSEIQFIDLRRPTYNRDLLSADYTNLVNGYPQGSSFMNYPNLTREQVEQAWRTLNNRVQTTPKPKTSINKSGLTKEEAIAKASAKDKDAISKMSEKEFEETVLKPTGEVVPYYQGSLEPQFTGKNNVFAISPQQYIDEFNSRLDILNDIIAKNNKSGVQYRVKELTPDGRLIFETPEQTLHQDLLAPKKVSGTSSWNVRINPGRWRGEVQDIPNTNYFQSIPGLEMSITSAGVFPTSSGLRGIPGTKAYESINEYLKKIDLGRVKSGFNSQTVSEYNNLGQLIKTGSKDVWEHFIKSGKGYGFYGNPKTVHGVMMQSGGIFKKKNNKSNEINPLYKSNKDYVYNAWRNSLPENLREESKGYNLRGAWEAGLEPEYVTDDMAFHLSSRDPYTGEILKAPGHISYDMAIEGDIKMGYGPRMDLKTGKIYTINPNDPVTKGPFKNVFAKGGLFKIKNK